MCLVTIIEFKGKKILMLGDSTPSIIENQLKKIYLDDDFPVIFDAIKIAHHGSIRNISDSLLELIDSEKYFISTNGKVHGHPDIEAIAKIVVRKNKDIFRKIYFTHKIPKLKLLENEEWEEKYKYKFFYKEEFESVFSIDL